MQISNEPHAFRYPGTASASVRPKASVASSTSPAKTKPIPSPSVRTPALAALMEPLIVSAAVTSFKSLVRSRMVHHQVVIPGVAGDSTIEDVRLYMFYLHVM